jgi:hypothetical protein
MAVTHDPRNANQLIDMTDEINQIDRQYAIFDDSLFDFRPTTQTAILFDINATTTTLLPASERGSRGSSYGSDDTVETRAIPLGYFKHSDAVTQEDILGVRQPGTANGMRQVDVAVAEKLEKMRRQADQTLEYMKLKAVAEGKCVSPDGVEYVNMFYELGIDRTNISLDVGTATTDIGAKLREIKRTVRANLKNGGMFNGYDLYLAPDLYEAVITHDSMKEAYKYFAAQVNPMREDITEMFRTNGVNIYSLDGSFKLPTGSSADLVASDTGFVVPRVDGLFRGYYGPSSKLSRTHVEGAVEPMYAWTYDDGRDEAIETTIEMAPLVFPTEVACLLSVSAA